MKKEVIILISFLTILILSNFVLASDVAYIVKKNNQVDKGFINTFNEMGLNVKIIQSKNIPLNNFSKYKFIFIGDNRLTNVKYIPTNLPMVFANHYYGKQLGFMKKGKVSKLTSNSPMQINKNGELIKVYTKSGSSFFKKRLSLYYLSNKYGDGYMNSIAIPYTGSKKILGDVIAYSKTNNKCFFGITKTKYWTPESKELFKACVNFVLNNPQPPTPLTPPETGYGTGTHDIEITLNHPNSIDGIRIKDIENSTYLTTTPTKLNCNKKYKIDFKTINIGNFTEDVLIEGNLETFTWSKTKTNLEPTKSKDK